MSEVSLEEGTRPRASALTVPPDVLDVIFSFAIDIPPGVRHHGGYLASWLSNESTTNLALVCKDWHEIATNTLYRSVSLRDRSSTDFFLRTVTASALLANKVNFLVLSLDKEGLQSASDAASLRSDSIALLDAFRACAKSITHLQIRPLHSQARSTLFEVLESATNLKTLVCSPRFFDPSAGPPVEHDLLNNRGGPASSTRNPPFPPGVSSAWATDFYSRTDLYDLALPSALHTVELDYESSWSARTLPIHNGLNPKALRKLRLRCDTDQEVLWQVLEKCTDLEICELYFERLLSRDDPTFDDLTFFDATAEPTFDRLLPSLTSLEVLSVSATEISTSVFRLIPPSLLALEVQAFNHVSTFVYHPDLIADLRNPRYSVGLKSLRVHDAAEAWEVEHIQELTRACEEREIEFAFRPDSEAGSPRMA
ncbi:hypothetical protein JCM11641_002228 [Rhodosporidiobolus odoratus]